MSIQVKINDIDKTNTIVNESLVVNLNLNNIVDTAQFKIIKKDVTVPEFNDDIKIYDGAVKILGGKILSVNQRPLSNAEGIEYNIKCVDHNWEFDKTLVSRTYTSETVADIISDLVSSFASGFTNVNATSDFVIDKIVFNQVPLGQCLQRLADILQYNWYIDPDKDAHFFPRNVESAPFKITDDDTDADYGKHIVGSLQIIDDGSQMINVVKVRGGKYEGSTFTDSITVNGNDTKSFLVDYKFSNFTVKLNTVAQTVGIDNINDFTSYDVLYNYQEKSFRFENNLSDSDVVEYSGNPKTPVLAIAKDSASIAKYGIEIEKLIEDNSIEDKATARQRARAELLTFANSIVDARVRTYESGLKAGQTIKVYNSRFNIDEDLIIKSVKFSQYGHDTFQYSLDLVSTKRYTLIEMLQSLLTPDPKQADDAEVDENMITDLVDITVLEELTIISPVEYNVDITVSENYYTSPTERTWVLGYYFPTSQSDIKRMGRLSKSMKLY